VGEAGLIETSTFSKADQVVFSIVGAVGLAPIIAAVRKGKSIAVANKEPLVMAGELIMEMASQSGARIIPIDSEHSGIWQCLHGQEKKTVKSLILTSSGGPFLNRNINFKTITPKAAVKHPKWKMGPKISIDSATLMNKALEVIEASNLFDIAVDRIRVVIHPEAVVHAMVEFVDGGCLAQLSVPDMRIPIQYAITYPDRMNNLLSPLNLSEISTLHFYAPDVRRFPSLGLGYAAKRMGGTLPAVLNAATKLSSVNF